MKFISIRDINTDWAITLPIPRFEGVTVGQVKESICSKGRFIGRSNWIHLVFHNNIMSSDDILLSNVVPTATQELMLFLIVINPQLCKYVESISFDDKSLNTATKYLELCYNTNSEISGSLSVAMTTRAFSDTADQQLLNRGHIGDGEGNIQEQPIRRAAGNDRHDPHHERPPIRWINIGLLFRLGVAHMLLLTQTESSYAYQVCVNVCMTIIYFWKVDALPRLVAKLRAFLHELANDGNNENNPIVGGALRGNRAAAVHQQGQPQGQQQQEGWRRALGGLLRMSQNGISIPRTEGLIFDIVSMFIALFASIIPSWEPA